MATPENWKKIDPEVIELDRQIAELNADLEVLAVELADEDEKPAELRYDPPARIELRYTAEPPRKVLHYKPE